MVHSIFVPGFVLCAPLSMQSAGLSALWAVPKKSQGIEAAVCDELYLCVDSGSAVLLANHFLPAFRKALGVSGKTALIVSAPR